MAKVISGSPPVKVPRRRMRRLLRLVIWAGVLAYFILILWPKVVITVPAGSVGVRWRRLFGGTVIGSHLNEGLQLKLPWDEIYLYSVRLKRLPAAVVALTKDGVSVTVNMSVTYAVNPDTVGLFNQVAGNDFEPSILTPMLTSVVMLIVSAFPTDALYSGSLDDIHGQVINLLQRRIAALTVNRPVDGRVVDIIGIDLTSITLPEMIRSAIDEKVQVSQDVQRHQLLVDRERLVSERRGIEGQSLNAYQTAISLSLTDNYLRLKAIEAASDLARSPNAKTIVTGGGSVPLILGDFNVSPPAAAPAPPVPLPAAPAVPAPLVPAPALPVALPLAPPPKPAPVPAAAPPSAPPPARVGPAEASRSTEAPAEVSRSSAAPAEASRTSESPAEQAQAEEPARRPHPGLQPDPYPPPRSRENRPPPASEPPARDFGLSRLFGKP